MPFHLKRQPIVTLWGGVVGGNASNDRECAKLRIGSRPNTSIQFLEASGWQEAAKCFLWCVHYGSLQMPGLEDGHQGKNTHTNSACQSNVPPNSDDHPDPGVIIGEEEGMEGIYPAGIRKRLDQQMLSNRWGWVGQREFCFFPFNIRIHLLLFSMAWEIQNLVWHLGHCGGLNEKCPPRLRHVNSWSLVSGAVLGKYACTL